MMGPGGAMATEAESITTYLEMRDPQTPQATPPHRPGVLLRVSEPQPSFYRFLMGRLGAPDPSAGDDALAERMTDADYDVYVLYHGGVPAALFELDRREPAEIELVSQFSRERRLAQSLAELSSDFDMVFVDCPPSLGLITVNALTAAHEVLIPIQCEYYALEGLSQLLRNISLIQQNLNPELDIEGVVLTMYDRRTKLAADVAKQVRDHFGDRAYRTVIPRTVRLAEAPSFGEPIESFDASSRGAIAYRALAEEFRRRHGRT
jgi:cellulose biosynthesis protein BcsQ